MSPKQPSKQKRAAQNRNQRAARSARAAHANATPASSSSGRATAPASSGGSLLSRLRGGGTGASRTRSAGALRTRGAAQTANQPPGYRAALSAVIAAAAVLMLSVVALPTPVNARGDIYTAELLVADWSVTALRTVADQPDATPAKIVASIDDWAPGRSKEPYAQALWPFSLALALPLIGAGLGFHAVRRRSRSKVVNRALYATLFGAILTQSLLVLFLPVVVAMAVAMFQVRKAETMAAASGDADVIEVTEVDDEPDVGEVSASSAED